MCCDSLALASTFSFITPSHSLFLLAGREENAPRLRQLAPILVVASLRKEFRLFLIFQTDPRLTATSHRFDQRTFFLSSMSNPWSTNWDAESHDSEDADEGGMVADRKHWWPTSLGSASWASEDSVKGLIASPLVYHLPDQESNSSLAPKLEDVSLNQDHLACRLAEAAVASYEANVGFGYAVCPPIDHDESRVVFSLEPTSDAKERARRVVRLAALKRLIQMLQEERGDAVERTPSLDNEDSLSSSLTDSTYSENSGDFFAMPATPTSKASYANVLLKNVSPSSSLSDESPIATPSKQLSPFATSFVPGSAEASGFSSFTFPTLNPPTNSTTRLTTVKIKKDDQGFFTSDVQVDEDTEPKSSLPSFLQQPSPRRRTRMSKTREMVDRLRADNLTAKCISLSPSPDVHCDLRPSIQPRLTVSEDGGDRDRESNLSTPSQDDEDEEWMCVSSKAPEPTASTSKAKRARDMLLALTRRMTTESTSSEASSKDDTAAHAKRPSSSHYSAPNSDGWIEGLPTCESPKPAPQRSASTKPLTKPPPPPKKKQHHSSKSSSTTSSSVPSLLPSPTHASFPTGPSPYMPMMSPPPAQFGFSIPPSPPVAVPMPFFFGPAAPVGPPPPGYPHAMHPHPHALPQVVPYSPPAVAYMPQSPFVPVPIHPGYSAVVAGVGPKMGGMYQSPGVWNQGQKRQAWPGYGKV